MLFNIFKKRKQSYNLSAALKICKAKQVDEQVAKIDKEPANFETALAASGFGRFNILLLLAISPGAMATIIDISVMSFVLTSAECDLKLDLVDKGILNAITFVGMIISAVAWGYLADTKGRKQILVWGFLLDVLCVLASALSQSFVQLMISKFFGGLIIAGPFAVLMSYLSEFHNSKHREPVIMIIGIMFCTAALLLPIVAMLVLPLDWNFDVLNLNFTSWKIYVALCGIPSLMSGIFLCFFPESPRFSMSQGRIEEALETFRTMYSINTGYSKDTFPIKELINEKAIREGEIKSVATIEAALKDANLQSTTMSKESHDHRQEPSAFRALFIKPYLRLSVIVYLMNFFALFGQITMRVWLPQLFASMHEYEQISNGTTNMCSILEYSVNKTAIMKDPDEVCTVVITPATYTNNIIVSCANLIGFFIAGSLVNWLGHKRIQMTCLLLAGTCAIALYFSSSAMMTLILTTTYMSLANIATISTVGTSVSLFPTSLRTMIVSVSWMCGHAGTVLGSILFPIFMSLGCIPPFAMIGCVMFLACILSACLPNTKNVSLK